MSDTLIAGVSGVRGVVGTTLTPQVAADFACAFAADLDGPVVVGRDSRPSGAGLAHAVTAGLLAAGRRVVDMGIVPTPTLGFLVRHEEAAGGVQITASHNPAPWNGLKLFGPDGAVLDPAAGRAVLARFEAKDFKLAAWDGFGTLRAWDSSFSGDLSFDPHEQAVAALQPDWSAVRQLAPTVLIDGNGGAGGWAAVRLAERLGATAVPVNCKRDGHFAHDPEPTAENLRGVAPLVREKGAAVGFALDPDADRLALIDETGTCLSEELTLALAVLYRLRRQPGPVVVNMSTSRVVEDVARRFNCPFHRSAVGEANVVGLMRRVNAAIGGEGNGGVIEPRVGWVRDPFVGMAYVLALLAQENKPLSAVVAGLPRYAMIKRKYEVPRDRLPAVFARLRDRHRGGTVNEVDGLRVDLPDGWVHVRGSNTEPVVRVIAEAADPRRAEELAAVEV